jgi:hypothetical protein
MNRGFPASTGLSRRDQGTDEVTETASDLFSEMVNRSVDPRVVSGVRWTRGKERRAAPPLPGRSADDGYLLREGRGTCSLPGPLALSGALDPASPA